ncbi:MAG: hypothetical protein RLY31_639 [Bacteroidota bacterium]|jgi:uncharacterized metal-binding protein YceD (DUF177 family)
MKPLDQFTLPISGLRVGLHAYDFAIGDEFFRQFEGSDITSGKFRVHVDFDKRQDFFQVGISFEGTVRLPCDRCLEDFDLPLSGEEVLLVKFDETPWEDADVVYILPGTQEFNLARYIYEYIHLAMPMTRTHSEAGLSCDPGMLKYLTDDAPASPVRPDPSVWDTLKGLQHDN